MHILDPVGIDMKLQKALNPDDIRLAQYVELAFFTVFLLSVFWIFFAFYSYNICFQDCAPFYTIVLMNLLDVDLQLDN